MNKTELKKFAVEARRDLIEKVSLKAEQYGITKENPHLNIEKKYGQVIVNNRNYSTEISHGLNMLERRLKVVGYEQLIEEVAYTWFNRIIAIRYMEVNDYLPEKVNILSSTTGKVEPDVFYQFNNMKLKIDSNKVDQFMQEEKTAEAYKLIFVAVCNELNNYLPTLFEKINDYTELLLPDYLLDSEFVISKLVENESLSDSFQEVEVIGWLYQYYNLELKDNAFLSVSKNKKLNKSEIPAATQFFTPKWIVQYLVENSLGAIWLEAYPDSPLKLKMKHYIEPAGQTDKVKKIIEKQKNTKINLEEIEIIDPCVGSGHILIYAFDLLYQMYEEAGYLKRDIPSLILENNLYGLDIDKRACQLSSFSLLMKAREKSKRIFNKEIKFNIYEIQETDQLPIEQLLEIINTTMEQKEGIKQTLEVFKGAKNFGSLAKPEEKNYDKYFEVIDTTIKNEIVLENSFLIDDLKKVKEVMEVAKILSGKYCIAITNPPYIGNRKGMNSDLKKYIQKFYNKSKSNLYSCFIDKCGNLTVPRGLSALVTPHSFMYTDDFKKFREYLLNKYNFITMAHLGTGAFPEISGEVVQTSAFIIKNNYIEEYKSNFIRLVDYNNDMKENMLHNEKNYYNSLTNKDFKNIKGSPITYSMSNRMRETFLENEAFDKLGNPRAGITTGNNEKFVRYWYEVNIDKIKFDTDGLKQLHSTNALYVPYNKGGEQRKWYGNNLFVIKFDRYNYALLEKQGNHLPSRQYYFQKSITWSDISGRNFAARLCDTGFVFDVKGSSAFPEYTNLHYYLALLNSYLTPKYIDNLNPTLTTQVGDLKRIPIIKPEDNMKKYINRLSKECVKIAKIEWDRNETSWEFSCHPWVNEKFNEKSMHKSFNNWRSFTEKLSSKLNENERKINKSFEELYKIEYNSHYKNENKHFLLADRITETKSFLSYFIGCHLGRYSLDSKGLANAGGKFDDKKYATFKPNENGLIQLTEEQYFKNDVIVRLKEFLSVAFNEDTVDENIKWLAESLTMRKNESPEERLRRYFMDEFFKDHCKTYQKRPIYWLVDSGKQKGLRTLIYMHRYQPDTMATIRFEHLQEIQSKYQNEIEMLDIRLSNPDISASDRKNLEKSKESYQKKIEELQEFDKKLAVYANEPIDIDLDDGVKVNYAKFDDVLAKIK